MAKNLIVSRNPARKRRTTAKQRAAARRNIKKAQAANRRGKTRRRTTTRRRRRSPAARRSYRRASNPKLPRFNTIINNQVMPALVGGAGAVLDDILVNVVPLPANWKTGNMRHVTKAVGAIAIGYVGAMFLPRKTANELGAGAMTVVGYNVVRDLAARFAPQLPLGGYLETGMGEYLDPASGLGYYGAGLNPNASQFSVGQQFTRGTPYMGDGGEDALSAWPTGSDYDEADYL